MNEEQGFSNDPMIHQLLNENLLNQLDLDRMDPSMRPLNESELRHIKLEKASDKKEKEICSICCDEIVAKARIRRMPECRHSFHQKCIDNWLKMKPICPNCNRKTRDLISFNE